MTTQKILIDHVTGESDLSKALSLFRANYSADLTIAQRLKFQIHLKDHCSIFLFMDEEERAVYIQQRLFPNL